jgi:hypothetical protein
VGVGSANSCQAAKGKGSGPGAGGKSNSALDGSYRCHTQVRGVAGCDLLWLGVTERN